MTRHNSVFASPLIEEQELVRQLQLARCFFEEMGGSLPRAYVDPTQIHTALDVGCGAGGWVLDVARAYPHIQVTGIDRYTPYIAYAQRLAREGDLSNATFLVQDMQRLGETALRLPQASFDLVHLAFLASTLLTTDYPALLRTLFQMCRPGGMVCWTEMEFPLTSSPAFQRLVALTCRALEAAGQSFVSPSLHDIAAIFNEQRREAGLMATPVVRSILGIMPMMRRWFREIGFRHIQHISTAIEVSAGMGAHPCFVRQVEMYGRQITPFLLEQGVIAEEACALLLSQVQVEVREETFCGLCCVLTVCAHPSA